MTLKNAVDIHLCKRVATLWGFFSNLTQNNFHPGREMKLPKTKASAIYSKKEIRQSVLLNYSNDIQKIMTGCPVI